MSRRITQLAALLLPAVLPAALGCNQRAAFRVQPYLQNPASDAMTVIWFSHGPQPGAVTVAGPDGERTLKSTAVRADALCYHPAEVDHLPADHDLGPPYKHRVRLTGLEPQTTYRYRVRQGGSAFAGRFRTAPAADGAVRFIVYADSETEPESTGSARRWAQPFGNRKRLYLVDQTIGYAENLKIIAARQPDFIAIAGDLVEIGGEQRDWDEFWRHNAGDYNDIASTTPIFPALGNHDNYGGPDKLGRFSTAGVRRALAKFRTYFEVPDNGGNKAHRGRYYRVDYGPVTLITLDSSNGLPQGSSRDTNLYMVGEGEVDEHGSAGLAPDFNPGSRQYEWLTEQLADAQRTSRFTFVQFHHMPYSVGPHSFPPGTAGQANGEDRQSGVPLRVLTPVFMRYGVDAVFCGHDELYEHAVVRGTEQSLDGAGRAHAIHFYDIGIGGDGLRAPARGPDGEFAPKSNNEHQVFLAHLDAPEVWHGRRLVDGGKHYGHLEVNVDRDDDGFWKAELTPVCVFPLMDDEGKITGWQRRVYDDVVTLSAR
jgi:3',5'-cyclic AMP phosphodiesterase CpdA